MPRDDPRRAVPSRGRLALAGLLRREEADAHERRVPARAQRGRLHRALRRRGWRRGRASGDPSDREAPWTRSSSTARSSSASRPWSKSASRRWARSRDGRLLLPRRVPSSTTPPSPRRSAATRWAGRCSTRRSSAFATVDWNAEALHEATSALGEALGLALRKSPGADSLRGHRHARSARRSSSRWNCSGARQCSRGCEARWPSWRPRDLRPAQTVPAPRDPRRVVIVIYFAVTFVQIWLTGHEHSQGRRPGDPRLRHHRGQRHASPGAPRASRPGPRAVPPSTARRGSRSPAASDRATRSPRRGCRRRTSSPTASRRRE